MSDTIKVTVTAVYTLSATGRAAALAAGVTKPAAQQQIAIEIQAEWAQYVRVNKAGEAYFVLSEPEQALGKRIIDAPYSVSSSDWRAGEKWTFDSPQTQASIVAHFQAILDKQAAMQREREETAQAYLIAPDTLYYVYLGTDCVKLQLRQDSTEFTFDKASPVFPQAAERRNARVTAEFTDKQELIPDRDSLRGSRIELHGSGLSLYNGSFRFELPNDHPATIEARRRRAEFDAQEAAAKAERARADAERKAEDARREQVKTDQIAAWVREHGTPNQQERFLAGLFPVEEAVSAMKEAAFIPLADRPQYKRLTNGDVRATCADACRCNDDYEERNCGVDFSTEDAETASDSEWEQVKQLQAAMPDAEVTLRIHTGKCDDRDCNSDEGEGVATRKSIHVVLTVGAFTFNRNFAVE